MGPEGTTDGGAGTVAPPAAATASLSPVLLAYGVGPVALVLLLVLRHFELVAGAPVWLYAAVILVPQGLSQLLERWKDARPGSWRLHVRVAVHVAAVTSVIYLSGWGPALGMAFAFSAFADLQQSGAAAWPQALGWSLAGCAAGQLLVLEGWMPSFLSRSPAQTIGFLGAFVFGIAIRMAGAIGEYKERAESQLAEQTVQVARARDDAERSAAHYRAVVENAAEGILTVELDGSIGSFNAAAEAMFGWTTGEIVGRPAVMLIQSDLREAVGAFLEACRSAGDVAAQRKDVEVRGVRRDGSEFPMMVSTSAVGVDSSAPIVTAILRDLSDQKCFEAQLAHQVLHDALTGLPNRLMLTDRLEQALARLRRGDRMFGVLFVDLDRFKAVNDTLGHTVGDQLLVEAAARIQTAVREIDTVARLGGDEFVVLCENIDGVNHATDLAQRIRAALERPFSFGDDEPHVSASIGIALCADGDETADGILANADIAMYRAKDNGRNCYELFDEAMQQWVTAQVALEADLRQAVARDELSGSLPAVRRGRHRRDPRVRGARPLGTPRLRSRHARQLHPTRRRVGADRRHRRMGARSRVPPRGGVESALARSATRRGGQRLEPPAPRRRHHGGRFGRARPHRSRSDPSHARAHREHADRRRGDCGIAAPRAPLSGCQPRARRLRDGLLVAHVPARVPDRTSSRSTSRSCVRSAPSEKTPRSSPRSSRSRGTSVSVSWPRASNATNSSPCSTNSGVPTCRVTSSRSLDPRQRSPISWKGPPSASRRSRSRAANQFKVA